MINLDRKDLFDKWAKNYDESVISAKDYPFDGYERVLDRIVEIVKPNSKMRILDLGTGTGNLAKRFMEHKSMVWGLDYSNKMLSEAKKKYPNLNIIQADILGDWMQSVAGKFDCIVSAYVFHEFNIDAKIDLIQRLFSNLLEENSCLVIGDVAFPTKKILEKVKLITGKTWDEEEYYWVAEETLRALELSGYHAEYEQISSCGGIFFISRKNE